MKRLFAGATVILAMGLVACFGGEDDEEAECGNGYLEGGEMCEWDSDPINCADLGLGQGMITCSDQCQFVFNGCVAPPTCGNALRDAGEACDGTDLGGMTCGDLGYDLGALSCAPNCTYDLTACCGHGCGVETDTRCVGDLVQSCVEQTTGCLDWQDAEDCAALTPAQVCDATTLDAQCVLDCEDTCPAVGAERCDAQDTAVQTCDLQASGCLDWDDSEDCTVLSPTAFCRYTGGAPVCQPCLADCFWVGDERCNGDVLEHCVQVVPGCTEWQELTDCALQGEYCGGCSVEDPPNCIGGC